MAEIQEISAQARDKVGKGAARAVRREGLVPGVIYGDRKPPQPISLPRQALLRHLQSGSFLSTLYMIDVGGEKTRVIARDVQFDPVRDFPIHVDFLRVAKGATLTLWIPVRFVNEEDSPGLKRGGVLNIVRHEVEVTCPVDNIPEEFVIDLAGRDIGEAIHSSDLDLPEGVRPTITDRDFTIATIAAPTVVSEAAEEEAEEEAPAAVEEAAEDEEEEGGEA